MPRAVIVFAGVLVLAGLLYPVIGFLVPPGPFWVCAVVLAFVLSLLSKRVHTSLPARGAFLCDTCKYNHPDTCSLPDRPNATRCPDYRSKF